MGSSSPPTSAPTAEFLAAFRARLGARDALTFAEFMALALYDESVGYYRRNRTRVGYGPGTDFYTASTSGPIFGELVAAAATHLLDGENPRDFTFVEIGTETGGGVLAGVAHPFGSVRTVAVGEVIRLAGNCVVFSNELFDAQPFRRFVRRERDWQEIGVAWRDSGFVEVPLTANVPEILPDSAAEGYVIDAPLASAQLLKAIAAEPWRGVLLAFDYGKSWRELAEATPEGTARAYWQHTQSNALLARPGEQDLTCHVCWDWLEEALRAANFDRVSVDSQEGFFIRHAADYIAATSAAEAARFSQKKLSLLQLLHPSHLGQKFQVLQGRRL